MDLGLKGSKAILAGAGASIGRRVAETLAQEGCDVALCARRADSVERVVSSLRDMGVKAIGESVDAADAEAFPAWVARAADELGGCDIFISFVSVNPGADTVAGWQQVFDTDILPLVRGIQAALPALQKSESGSIITISSTGALEEFMGPQPYNALKAAVINYSAALAQKHAPEGLRVNCISPGPIYADDGPWETIKNTAPEFYDGILNQIPLGRLGTAEELAKAIAFVASPACRYMTGANIVIDGAFTRRVQY